MWNTLPLGEQSRNEGPRVLGAAWVLCVNTVGVVDPPPAWATCPSFPPFLTVLSRGPHLSMTSCQGFSACTQALAWFWQPPLLQPHLQHKSLSFRWPIKILGAGRRRQEKRKKEGRRQEGQKEGRKLSHDWQTPWENIGKICTKFRKIYTSKKFFNSDFVSAMQNTFTWPPRINEVTVVGKNNVYRCQVFE